jgi:TPM domain
VEVLDDQDAPLTRQRGVSIAGESSATLRAEVRISDRRNLSGSDSEHLLALLASQLAQCSICGILNRGSRHNQRRYIVSKVVRTIAPLLLLLLLAAPALAQSGRLIYHDDAGRLDRSKVQSAARSLTDRGAQVAIYTVASNGGPDDFLRRLEQDGLYKNGSANPALIAIYVSFSPRYSEIRGGDNWNAALKTNNNIDAIRNNELNPGLAAGDATAGFVNALKAVDQSVASPPRAGGGTTVNVNFVPIVLGVIFLVLLLVGGPIVWRSISRRRTAAQALQGALQAAEQARRQAGAAIADLGQALRDAREKAQYDAISYTEADVAQITQWQGAAEQQFTHAQEQFDKAEEALASKREPAQADYQAVAAQYGQVTQLVDAAREPLERAAARRLELDKVNAQAPGEVDRAKKALADAAGRLGAPGEDFARPDAITRQAAALVARAESLLAEHRAADAITAAGAASAAIDSLNQALTRYADIHEGISAGRAGAEKAAAQGFRIEAGMAAFDKAEGLLRQAAQALEQGPERAAPLLDQAEAARAEGVGRGGGMPALRRENDARLPRVEQAGEQLAAYIAEGRRAFDAVDEFAESAWSDIRGNGSEAEAAAARAHALWQRASERNTMEAQDFYGAKEDLDAAEEQIAHARTLIDTIMQRLKDLEAARDAARAELATAQADIDAGWTFVRSNDPDVGKQPEQALKQAAALVEQAGAELSKERPDWLAIVKQAREANRLADEAIANARGEVAEMDKLRGQVTRAQQLATAEVQKIVKFASLHADDLPRQSEQQLNALQADVQAAYAALKAAEQREEEARAAALRDALARYDALEAQAEKLYGDIYAAFQRVEQLRQQVAQEAERAERAVARAEQLYRTYGGYIPASSEGVALLQAARATLGRIGAVRDDADMKRAMKAAVEARGQAERAEQIFRNEIAARQGPTQGGDSLGDFVGGVLVGTLLSGGGRHGRHGGSGWGGSWGGGGSSGGSWGGGSSSGGSWGGGSSSGGSWGGGSSSGGGW